MPILSSLVTPQVVRTKICSATCDDKVGIMKTHGLECIKGGVLRQKQVSMAGTSNYIPQYVGCNYLSLPLIPPSGTTLLKGVICRIFPWSFVLYLDQWPMQPHCTRHPLANRASTCLPHMAMHAAYIGPMIVWCLCIDVAWWGQRMKGHGHWKLRIDMMPTTLLPGGIVDCYNDMLRCNQWRPSWHRDNSWIFSVWCTRLCFALQWFYITQQTYSVTNT